MFGELSDIGGGSYGQVITQARGNGDFLDTLDGKISNPIPARVGARTVSICEAALNAIETGQPQVPDWF